MSKKSIILATEKIKAVKEYLDGKGSTISLAEKYGVAISTIYRWLIQYQQHGETAFSKRKSKEGNFLVSPQDKLKAVRTYLAGEGSIEVMATKYSVSYSSLYKWITKYKTFGEDAFLRNGKNATYSSDLKQKVVEEYLSGNISREDLAIKYKISSSNTVSEWILKYNGHESLKASEKKGGCTIMTKGRKTSYDERIEIVKYCIEHSNNYAETAKIFKTSYQQVYSWCKKYETGGVEALQDRRGHKKTESDMTELEKLRAENKLLQAQNRRIQIENDFLKKLEEIERR